MRVNFLENKAYSNNGIDQLEAKKGDKDVEVCDFVGNLLVKQGVAEKANCKKKAEKPAEEVKEEAPKAEKPKKAPAKKPRKSSKKAK
jgi:hypothetical protein